MNEDETSFITYLWKKVKGFLSYECDQQLTRQKKETHEKEMHLVPNIIEQWKSTAWLWCFFYLHNYMNRQGIAKYLRINNVGMSFRCSRSAGLRALLCWRSVTRWGIIMSHHSKRWFSLAGYNVLKSLRSCNEVQII